MPNGAPRGGTARDETKWTKAGEETWEEEQDVVVDTLWHSALSNMRKRASVHLDSEDIRKARQFIFAEHRDHWLKKLGRVTCYLAIAAIGITARNATEPISPSYSILFVCVTAGVGIWAALEFLLNKR